MQSPCSHATAFARFTTKRLKEEFPDSPTGAELAREILKRSRLGSIEVREHKGTSLADHYDERRKVLVLASANFHGRSTAALGIAAQEVGHALQHAAGYTPLVARQSAMRMTVAMSGPVLILCLLLIVARLPMPFILFGFALTWGMMMFYNLITMPVEFDASRRAKEVIEDMSARFKVRQLDGIYAMMRVTCWRYTGAFMGSLRHVPYHLFPAPASKADE